MKKDEELFIDIVPYDISWKTLCDIINERFPEKYYERKNIIISHRRAGILVKAERNPEV